MTPDVPSISPDFETTKRNYSDTLTIKNVLVYAEGVNLAKKRGRPRRDKRGRKREGRSLGRYPLLIVVGRYLEKRKLMVCKSTLANENRILVHIDRVLKGLKKDGLLENLNPQKMSPEDVRAFIDWMEIRGFEPESKAKYLHCLNGVLLFCKNPVIENMKRDGFRLPRRTKKPIHAIAEADLLKIQGAAEKMKGWVGVRTRFLVVCYPATGLRPSELRLAHLDDLNIKTWTLFVRHPKGEGTYGQCRKAIILPQYRSQILQYLKQRNEYVKSMGLSNATYLIPRCEHRRDDFYSANAFRKLKVKVEEASGVGFKLKDFRPTFATMSVELDPNLLPDISTMLGHADIKTTQRYYAQISCDSAGRRLEAAWQKKLGAECKSDLIEPEKYMSRYA